MATDRITNRSISPSVSRTVRVLRPLVTGKDRGSVVPHDGQTRTSAFMPVMCRATACW